MTIQQKEQERVAAHAMLVNKVMLGAMFLFALLLAYLLFAFFAPIEILFPNEQPYQVLTKKVVQGERMKYLVDACKTRDAVGVVTRTVVVDKVEFKIEPDPGTVKKGCSKVVVSVLIPDTIPPGLAYMKIDVAYPLNPFRNLYYHLYTGRFEIIEKEVDEL